MTYMAKPKIHHPKLERNALGLTRRDYEGSMSTLCAGCGHDAISAAIIQACFDLDLPPHRIAKLSGIGCSSKTPTYFLGAAHGFNSVHGRMPSIASGANAANKDLLYIGVSGDGDTASIGLGQFVHAMRRGVNMLYMVENNGTYGLTKGQFSATADPGSSSKGGEVNAYPNIDLGLLALQMGATYVARSFSGDKDQLIPLLKGALLHRGFAFIDCISPCVTFNNHPGSTRSYAHFREHEMEVAIADFVPRREEITAKQAEANVTPVKLHDGSTLLLRPLTDDYDPHDKIAAATLIQEQQREGHFATGLLFIDPNAGDMHATLGTVDAPLTELPFASLCPGADALTQLNESLR